MNLPKDVKPAKLYVEDPVYKVAIGPEVPEGFELYVPPPPFHAWDIGKDIVSEIHVRGVIHKLPLTTDGRGADALYDFFDEAWRVLKPGARMTVIAPAATCVIGMADPESRRPIHAETFEFLDKKKREEANLGPHYAKCDFDVKVAPVSHPQEALRHPAAQAYRFTHLNNVVMAWQATLTKKA